LIEKGSEYSQDADPRYADLGADMPLTECLKDVVVRMVPYWTESIIPDLTATLYVRWLSTLKELAMKILLV
jgi:2,3-bisphosphoglycerate-dependent phosphoglycerate mutase